MGPKALRSKLEGNFLLCKNVIFCREISEKGKKITLKVKDGKDIRRFLFKSETCRMEIPEIEFSSEFGS